MAEQKRMYFFSLATINHFKLSHSIETPLSSPKAFLCSCCSLQPFAPLQARFTLCRMMKRGIILISKSIIYPKNLMEEVPQRC